MNIRQNKSQARKDRHCPLPMAVNCGHRPLGGARDARGLSVHPPVGGVSPEWRTCFFAYGCTITQGQLDDNGCIGQKKLGASGGVYFCRMTMPPGWSRRLAEWVAPLRRGRGKTS